MLNGLHIRSATVDDYSSIARLADQLGYPCDEAKVKIRIRSYMNKKERRIIVAELNSQIVGWTSIDVIDHFYLDPFVEISGFIVDEKYRSKGIGRELIKEAISWTKKNDYKILRLKTNIIRNDAHRFYENNGFKRNKEQYVYVMEI